MHLRTRHVFLLLCATTILLLALLVGGQGAATPALAALPTRTPSTPLPWPTPQRTATRVPVATLRLTVNPPQSGIVSVVQWQDAQQVWHDIEGWRGEVNRGQTTWWVEPKDWGAGPYRWVLYTGPATALRVVATSTPFTLPTRQGEVKIISVQVPSP